MRIANLFLISCAILLAACARPKYAVVEDADSNPKTNRAECPVLFKNSNLCLSWFWELKPTANDSGSLVFKIYRPNAFDQSQILLDPNLPPSLILWMPGMGHGSTPTQVERLDVGTYRATEVFFIMPGEWELKFQLKEGSEIKDEAVADLVF